LLRGDDSHYELPWSRSDDGVRAFQRLVAAVWDVIRHGVPNPRLEQLFDYYLTMVWQLSLWVPLPYVDVHPFDLTGDDLTRVFSLSPDRRGGPAELGLEARDRVRDRAGLGAAVQSPVDFTVTVDDLELRRPVRMRNLPATLSAVTTPLLFVANERQDFEKVDIELSGGPLAFQAYLLWAPKVAPTEHQGVLVRVHDATGTLFDSTFLRFPVAEQRRLSQICAEVFILEGFDGAINIDRESFNFAHPHVVAVTKWLHAALRRVIAVQKRIAAMALEERRAKGAQRTEGQADEVVYRVWSGRTNDDGTEPPGVFFANKTASATNVDDAYIFERESVIGDLSGRPQSRSALEGQLEKIVQILAAYNLLDQLSPGEQAELVTAIREILQAYES
jgi:hypothetical protein